MLKNHVQDKMVCYNITLQQWHRHFHKYNGIQYFPDINHTMDVYKYISILLRFDSRPALKKIQNVYTAQSKVNVMLCQKETWYSKVLIFRLAISWFSLLWLSWNFLFFKDKQTLILLPFNENSSFKKFTQSSVAYIE